MVIGLMLKAVMLNVIHLDVTILNVIHLSVIIPNVICLTVITLNVKLIFAVKLSGGLPNDLLQCPYAERQYVECHHA